MTNIFQINWINVDTVIIILLLLLLSSVKIFKITHRWRSSFSNQAVEQKCFSQPHEKATNLFFIIKQKRKKNH